MISNMLKIRRNYLFILCFLYNFFHSKLNHPLLLRVRAEIDVKLEENNIHKETIERVRERLCHDLKKSVI